MSIFLILLILSIYTDIIDIIKSFDIIDIIDIYRYCECGHIKREYSLDLTQWSKASKSQDDAQPYENDT
jgi:hypothetical protein